MYPSIGFMIENTEFHLPNYAQYCSLYGYSYGDSVIEADGKKYKLEKKQYFGLHVLEKGSVATESKLFLIIRLGHITPNTVGWVEEKGRLSYIDGCSDSLLVYPSRLGDPSLNLLYFPPGIDQTFHRHPSIRLGCVIHGSGFSCFGEIGNTEERVLESGMGFCLTEQERHRFRTEQNSMVVVAFHPDGDWGPTDKNHTMLNRTYIE
jgi:hypothetical protein